MQSHSRKDNKNIHKKQNGDENKSHDNSNSKLNREGTRSEAMTQSASKKKTFVPKKNKLKNEKRNRNGKSKPECSDVVSTKSKTSAISVKRFQKELQENPSYTREMIVATSQITDQRLQQILSNNTGSYVSKNSYQKLSNKNKSIPLNKIRRKGLPAKPKTGSSLWSILRNCLGKDLSNITIPVGFSEPISMLERIAEDFEYSYLLDNAAACSDPLEQLAIVTAFVISAYGSSGNRLSKPFLSLLGETFELDRTEDLGWKLMSEQVDYIPPTSAHYCESNKWKCWKKFTVETNLRGSCLKVEPSGTSYLEFDRGNVISWGRIDCTINNILWGKMWLDNAGETDVISHKYGNVCRLTFFPYDPNNKNNQRKVTGIVKDNKNEIRWIVQGKWDDYVEIIQQKHIGNQSTLSQARRIWQINPPAPEIAVYYNFGLFACQLNEEEIFVAPTDSRNREDIRLMEKGEWGKADLLKKKLEEKYRLSLKSIKSYSPIWFKQRTHPIDNLLYYDFTKLYWEAKKIGDWSKCPNIFDIST